MNQDDAILKVIKKLSDLGSYILTNHATDQRIVRGMSIQDVEDVLCNPTKIIRTDVINSISTYKIEGGFKKQRLAVEISGQNVVIVITAMD
ncbi:hypothetical protein BC351_10430 [Paenibacillus ferrarius]|uniref:DUF4258 domain-containing protein n=1 Tax=Paenibacillus ferrarius TaxID=1469647 RepID=A0A1V4H9B8_9BACL|nr:DUF4258 domain-containing protein [Paenibacillus ferrarius]OPH47599.1 hypothetical protein BC351_10430 [Paenibacillus ferrarius]